MRLCPRRLAGGLSAALSFALLVGCSSGSRPKPTALDSFQSTWDVSLRWSQRLDGGVGYPLAITQQGQRLELASANGQFLQLDMVTGEYLDRVKGVDGKLSAGLGSDGRFSAVVTREDELQVFDGPNLRWKARLDSRVVTAPLVAGERVFVLGVDRSVRAYDVLDGRYLWTLKRQGDPLTLSHFGLLGVRGDTLVVGQGNRLLGVEPLTGGLRWELVMATPRGTNEVERLADLVGPASAAGPIWCMRAFQNAVGCADVDRGSLLWTSQIGGSQAVAGDSEMIYLADGSDRITARRRAKGEIVWTQEKLLYRRLSAPAMFGEAVVFGDLEGQLHFLSRKDGSLLARLPTDESGVASLQVLHTGALLALTKGGGLYVFGPTR